MLGIVFDRRRQALELRRSASDNVAVSRTVLYSVLQQIHTLDRIPVNRQRDKALSDSDQSKDQSWTH
jgi:hypothetical protein